MSLSTNTLLASVQFQTLGNSRKDPRLQHDGVMTRIYKLANGALKLCL